MHKNIVDSVCCIAQEAADMVMHLRAGDLDVRRKADGSPVSRADEAAHRLICQRLSALTPALVIVSEEQDAPAMPTGEGAFWLIDPIDGTRSFIRGSGEFTVNIALIERGVATLGVIAVPASGELFAGGVLTPAFKQTAQNAPMPIRTRASPKSGLTVLVSSHHHSPKSEAFAKQFKVKERVAMASSLKFCRIAEGAADLHPRFGPTMQWDTAAGQAIVEAAGGRVTLLDGAPLRYGSRELCNPPFVVWGA